MPDFLQETRGLQPAKDVLDPLAFLNADLIAGMPRRAAVQIAAPFLTLVFYDVRGNL